ncbi:Transcriptional regulator [gamma proteobacterium HdN1]|nr:Transcriptional regulator [gamma proteobacterium HdN1]
MSTKNTGAIRLSREAAKRETRQRLLNAARDVLAEEGADVLTTGHVAKRAGIAQPTFYVHFRDMDDLLQALAKDQVGGLREQLRALRLQMTASGQRPEELIRETYRAPLLLLVRQRSAALRLLISEMYRPNTALGQAARNLVNDVIEDLYQDSLTLGVGAFIAHEKLKLLCEGVIMLTIHYGLSILEGRQQDLDLVVDVLTQMTMAVMLTAMPASPPISGVT